MKKILLTLVLSCVVLSGIFSQNYSAVDIDDNIYELLRSCEIQNLCEPLYNTKPYPTNYIVKKLNEILYNLEEQELYDQMDIIEAALKKYELEEGQHIKQGYIKLENKDFTFPTSMIMYTSFNINTGTGLYINKEQNAFGYETHFDLGFKGDIGNYLSYDCTGFLGVTKVPLEKLGDDYVIGEWLYSGTNQQSRTINTYRNNAFLPYRFSKFWDGSCYFFSRMDASGLEGWPFEHALAFAMNGEIHSSLQDNRIELGIARHKREWGAMDKGSSLVLNSHARPFLAAEACFHPLDNISLSCMTGVLEMPNQHYINANAWYNVKEDGSPVRVDDEGNAIQDIEDNYFFQNAFSMIMVEFDFTRFHFDFGSTTIWPKRFELGYAFPLIDNVIYQNNIGDDDNLALFSNMKFLFPGIGSIWISGYLDEINSLTTQFWEKARAMFAFQAGTKVNVPWLPFTTASFRYTKVEPYCYTHHSINYTPWYNQYISESYTNNGECIGYYLAPNSDEFNLQIESNPKPYMNVGLQYQLIRHGVDWGSGAGIGNNMYSELRNYNRDGLYKYFLHDGTYEWSSIISVHCNYNLREFDLPVKVNADLGYIFDWFTEIDGELGRKTKLSKVNNEVYSDKSGIVLNLSVSFLFD